MKTGFVILYMFAGLLIMNCLPSPGTELNTLVATERAFAAFADTYTTGEAFLKFLSCDALVFQPQPVLGHWVHQQKSNGKLVWQPTVAEIAASRDFGYTIGPWMHSSPAGAQVHGHYCSVWQNLNEEWKVVLDIGVSHQSTPNELIVENFIENSTVFFRVIGDSSFVKVEQQFFTKGWENAESAYAFYFHADCRILSQERLPASGKKDALANRQHDAQILDIQPIRIYISEADDFAYVAGTETILADSGKERTESFVRIWQHTRDGWKIKVWVMNEITD